MGKARRVVSKVRKLRPGNLPHLNFFGKEHGEDNAKMHEILATEVVRVAVEHPPSKEPFPSAAVVAFCWLRSPSGKLEVVSTADHQRGLAEAIRRHRRWYVKTNKVSKKNGAVLLQPRKGDPGGDIYFNFARWHTKQLARLVEAGRVREAVNAICIGVGAAMKEFARLTGYIVFGACIHPDSRDQLGFHIQYLKVGPIKGDTKGRMGLVGRSADGKEGRHGLKCAGDALSCVARYAEFVDVDATTRSRFEGRDDVAIIAAVDKAVLGALPEDIADDAVVAGKSAAEDWWFRRQLAVSSREAELSKNPKAALAKEALKAMRETGRWPIEWNSMCWSIWKLIPRPIRKLVAEQRAHRARLDPAIALRVREAFKEINQPQIKKTK